MSTTSQHAAVLPGPNEELLEAQSRVCTGPTQTRPLGRRPEDPDPHRVFALIADALEGAGDPSISRAQVGAFLCATTIRGTFPPETRLNAAETQALEAHRQRIETDPAARFLLTGEPFTIDGHPTDRVLADGLVPILSGRHLDYARTRAVLDAVLSPDGDPMLKAAVLIGQRMNLESDDEFRAYLDAVLHPGDVLPVDVDTLTTIGEPYNGSTRTFKPTCFVAAVRAALGRPTLLHGVDTLPPKHGVTDERILAALGARTDGTAEDAARQVEAVGWGYVSQRVFAPHAYAMRALRAHIGKRPTWAASEKAQQILRSSGRNELVVGFYHSGYEEKHIRSARERGFDAAFLIKGEEGTSQLSLRSGAPSDGRRKTLNYVEGYRDDATIALDVDPADHGFDYAQSPRPDRVDADTFAALGRAALSGEAGHARDRILLNAGILDWLLGHADDPAAAIAEAAKAVDSGAALDRLDAGIAATRAT